MADAADSTPKLVPMDEIMARDNSGGSDFKSRTAEFGDGKQKTSPKSALGA
jgi:hypothetical protein